MGKSKSEFNELRSIHVDSSTWKTWNVLDFTLNIYKTSQFTKPFPTLESHFIYVREGRKKYTHFIYKHAGWERSRI